MKKKNVLLGVTAGVAIYKSCDLVRKLIKGGFSVKVVMTPSATNLISPVLFRALAQDKVYVNMFDNEGDSMNHINLSKWAEVFVIAPLSANTMAKIAGGIGDNLLTNTILALPSDVKVVLAPAMNTNMWDNPFTRRNIEKISEIKNYKILDPVEGELACRDKGKGALVDVDRIVEEVRR